MFGLKERIRAETVAQSFVDEFILKSPGWTYFYEKYKNREGFEEEVHKQKVFVSSIAILNVVLGSKIESKGIQNVIYHLRRIVHKQMQTLWRISANDSDNLVLAEYETFDLLFSVEFDNDIAAIIEWSKVWMSSVGIEEQRIWVHFTYGGLWKEYCNSQLEMVNLIISKFRIV